MVNYKTETLHKQGTVEKGEVTYNVDVTVVNGELTRLGCSISRKVLQKYSNGQGGFTEAKEDMNVGSIIMEHGRQVIEVAQTEDVIPHVNQFQAILSEILGKKQTT